MAFPGKKKQMRERRLAKALASPGQTIHEFHDRWTIQDLRTKDELEGEGQALGHSVEDWFDGEGRELREPGPEGGRSARIFSLRDPDGAPRVTFAWGIDEKGIIEALGKTGRKPTKDELDRFLYYADTVWGGDIPRRPRLDSNPSATKKRLMR